MRDGVISTHALYNFVESELNRTRAHACKHCALSIHLLYCSVQATSSYVVLVSTDRKYTAREW